MAAGLLAARVRKARTRSRCPACGGPVVVGQRIGYIAGAGWCHVAPCITGRPCAATGRCAVSRGQKPKTREQELRTAVKQARLPPRDFKIFTVLLDRADFGTAEIPGRFQPKSLEAFAGLCEMSTATLCRGLDHLEVEGWIERARTAGGRGCSTSYTLTLGGRCWCSGPGRPKTPPGKPETLSGLPSETLSEYPLKPSQNMRLNPLRNSNEPAGQAPVSAEGLVMGGEMGGPERERGEELMEGQDQEPVCGVCGAPVSPLRQAQTLRRGVVCVRCEGGGGPPPGANVAARERRRGR